MDRKQPLWPTVTVTPFALALLCLVSFGPAFWLVGRGQIDERPVRFAYSSLIAWVRANEFVRPGAKVLRDWSGFGCTDGVPFWCLDERYGPVRVRDPVEEPGP